METAADLSTIDLFMQAGEYASALQDCRQLQSTAQFASNPGIARRAAYCLEKLGRYNDVVALLEPLLSDHPSVQPDPEDAVEVVRCRLILGKTLMQAGRMAEAQAQGHLALAAIPAGAKGPEAGSVHNLLGAIVVRQGDLDEARTHFRAALEQFRVIGDVINLSLAYMNLGNVYKQTCDWARAEEHYQAAYYLRAAEGEGMDQGMILQNLALVHMKVGRYVEAEEKLQASLRRALQAGDAARALRTRLTLARLSRESWQPHAARAYLQQCREQAPDPMPRREANLILIEEAALARLVGEEARARELLHEFGDRALDLSSRGDLALAALILEGQVARENGNWTDAEIFFQRAHDLAREERDRYQENEATLELMEVYVAARRPEEAEQAFRGLHDRLLHSGELPFLARLYELRGRMEQSLRGEAGAAVDWYRRSCDLWHRMGRGRLQAKVELRAIDALVGARRLGEATTQLQALRERLSAEDLEVPAIEAGLAHAEALLRDLTATSPPARLRGDRAFALIEDLVASDAGPGEKLRQLLLVLTEAFRSEGGLIARADGNNLEVVTSVSMGRLQSRRSFPASLLGVGDLQNPALLSPPTHAGRGESAERFSALAWPVSLFGLPHLVFVERRDGGSFDHGAVDYGMVLLAQASRGLRPVVIGPAEAAEELLGNIHLADVITQSPRMRSILDLIRRVADSELTVLLQGETGTGKKLLAEVLHRTSPRRDRPFVTVDCAALPDSLLESELFGHRKGAFTGATADRVGLLEEGNGGTIFLDEIDKSGLSVQRRLLHMLDSGEVRPVGATGYKRLDVRVVCATSCPDLRSEVAAGRFLKDLFYRLNDISIVVPPLRERPDDVPLLAEWFIERFSRKLGRKLGGVLPSFSASLTAHNWPGNVRELEKAIRRAVTLVDEGGALVPDLLPATVLESGLAGLGEARGLHDKVEGFERGLILEVLDRLDWNRCRAAAELGLSRRGLKNKIERYKLDRRRSRRK